MADENSDDIELDLGGLFGRKKKKPEHKEEEKSATEEQPPDHNHEEHKHHHEHKHEHEPGHSHHENKHEEHHKEHDHEHTEKKEDDEISIDLGGIFGGKKKKHEEHKRHVEHHESKKEDEEIKFDPSSAFGTFKSNPWIISLLLILFVTWLAVDVRMEPKEMGFTDGFAENSVASYFRGQIANQVQQQNPNLPANVKEQVIEEQYQKFFAENRDYVMNQIVGTSLFFKTAWSNEPANDCREDFDWLRCKPYMPDIDPYYWLRYAENIEDHGYPGDEMREGVNWDNHMLAPNGRAIVSPDLFHPYMLVNLHKIMTIFYPGITLYQSSFYYPVVLMGLATIFVYLIARRIAGDIAGLFAGAMFALNFASLNRTLFGHGDTDGWVLFFPILITFLYLESLESKKIWMSAGLAGLAGFFIGMYSAAWGGWWYIFDFILAMSGLYLVFHGIVHLNEIKKGQFLKPEPIKQGLVVLGAFILLSAIAVTIFNDFDTFVRVPVSSLGFTNLKTPVLATLWPNVLTTVAELNEGDLGNVINSIGGTWLFWLGLIGIGFTMLSMTKEGRKYIGSKDLLFIILTVIWYSAILISWRTIGQMAFLALMFIPIIYRAYQVYKHKLNVDLGVAILLSIWFAGTTYASFKGIRFSLLLAPAYSVAFGVFFGVLFYLIYSWLKENTQLSSVIKSSVVAVIFGAFFILWFWPPGLLYLNGGSISSTSYNVANSDVPIINDAWYTALTKIKTGSAQNAILTSWWDFGHHFKQIADRAVTFDGTTQDTPQAHWVGKSLMTSNERETKGILQMLACGGNNAFIEVNNIKNDTVKSVKILNKLHVSDKTTAESILRAEGFDQTSTDAVLKNTHCEPVELYYITSEDMIGKAGVWAHFGAWNFERAYVWNVLKNQPVDQATHYMVSNFNYTQKQAEDLYFEAQSISDDNAANAWVSPWPGYLSQGSCNDLGNKKFECPFNVQNQQAVLQFDATTGDAGIKSTSAELIVPVSVVYPKGDEIVTRHFNNSPLGISFAMLPQGTGFGYMVASPQLADSIFTKTFFYQGQGLEYLKPFTHEQSVGQTDIWVWKVDWDGGEKNSVAGFNQESASFDYIGYFDNGTVFDSSISNWQSKNVTQLTELKGRNDTSPLTYTLGSTGIIQGLDLAIQKMAVNETRFVNVPPALGYGVDPATHPLGNKTLNFKVLVLSKD